MVDTLAKAKAPGRTRYFDNNGSRGIYRPGWYACTFDPRTPWLTVSSGLAAWDSAGRLGTLTFDVGVDLGSPVSLDYFDQGRSRSTAPSLESASG